MKRPAAGRLFSLLPLLMLALAAPAFLPATAPAVLTGAARAAPDLKAIEQALSATRSMEATFRQTADDGRVTTGTMLLKRPGKVRFQYGNGVPYLVVADGKRLSFIDYRVAQVSEWPLSSTPLGVLLDPKADLSRLARVLPPDQSPLPGAIAVAAEDAKRPDYGRIIFFLKPDAAAPGGLALTGWRVTDAQNRLTIVDLANVRYNVPIGDSSFRFRDPRGAAPAATGRPG